MHLPVNSDLYSKLISLCKAGGLDMYCPTTIFYSNQGRIHQTYLVKAGGTQFVLQGLNSLVIRDTTAFEKLTNSVLAPASLAPELLPWPAAGDGFALQFDNSCWIRRPYIEGKALTNDLSIPLIISMARTLGKFHYSLTVANFNKANFVGINPWSGEANVALQNRLATGITLDSLERETIRTWRQCKTLAAETDMQLYSSDVVVHRDTKPSNFIQRQNGSLLLIDFDTIGTGDPAMDLGEIVRAWLSSDESESDTNSSHIRSADLSDNSCTGSRSLSDNCVDCALALIALETGYNDASMTATRIQRAAMQCCLLQCDRFLEDHFANDLYYPVQTHGDNLFRATQQLNAWQLLVKSTAHIENAQ